MKIKRISIIVSLLKKNPLNLSKKIKLREFNFKMLHGILPCNRNSKKWRSRLDDKCDVYELTQTIEHLLFECRYVKPLWDVIEKIIGTRISFKQILGLENLFRENSVLSVTSFLIYKGWLVLSLENKLRNRNICLSYFKNELSLTIEIYKMCKCINMEHIDKLSSIVL